MLDVTELLDVICSRSVAIPVVDVLPATTRPYISYNTMLGVLDHRPSCVIIWLFISGCRFLAGKSFVWSVVRLSVFARWGEYC